MVKNIVRAMLLTGTFALAATATQAQSIVQIQPPPDAIAMLAEKYSGVVGSTTNTKKDVVKKSKPKPKVAARNKPPPRLASSSKAAKAEKSKAVAELKPCRPNVFDELLQALYLSSRCQT